MKQDISNRNGQEVKKLLNDLVDNPSSWNWEIRYSAGKKHTFAVGGKPVMIESRPSQKQPGNGFVSFYNNITKSWIAPMWDNLKNTLKDPNFPSYYDEFNSQQMDEVVQDNVGEDMQFQAAFLLLFEIARRVKEVPESPMRYETEIAIGTALKISQISLVPRVSPATTDSLPNSWTGQAIDCLVAMFTRKKRKHPTDPFESADFPGRRKAYKDLLALKRELDFSRELEDYDLWRDVASLSVSD